MKLYIVNSNSKGNGYVLESSNGDQLLIEAGRSLSEFRKYGHMRIADVKGLITSHAHGDHSKFVKEFLRAGVGVYSTPHVASIYLGVVGLSSGETQRCGEFSVTPFPIKHDIPCYGYLIHHKECGTIFFATDCYDLNFEIHGIKHFLMEVNYQDEILRKAVVGGFTPQAQADRVRLSHMSLDNAIKYLHQCDVEDTCHTITLIHGSARHLYPSQAVEAVRSEFGVPTYYATKGLTVELI